MSKCVIVNEFLPIYIFRLKEPPNFRVGLVQSRSVEKRHFNSQVLNFILESYDIFVLFNDLTTTQTTT